MTNADPQDTINLEIAEVSARQILDSRGFPTIQVALQMADGRITEAAAPAGASTGVHEAAELRDGGVLFSGRGVQNAVHAAEGELADLLTGRAWGSIDEIDGAMRDLDGTATLARLGANTIVALSMAASRGFATLAKMPLYAWIGDLVGQGMRLPVPHFNVLNGGAHAANDLDLQEFMIAPIGATSFADALQCGAEVYHALAARVRQRYAGTGLGDEGGFAPPLTHAEEALDLIVQAIADAGYVAGTGDVAIALDPAANGFRTATGYRVAGVELSSGQLIDYYAKLVDRYPIWSIEDGLAEDDPEGWTEQFQRLGPVVQIMGDDLYVTDPARIADGAERRWSNSALIKPNQIGTVTQTLDAIRTARSHSMTAMVSHRSGETVDTFIADLAVGAGTGQIKSGAPARGERVAKYNRLASIAEDDSGLPFGL